jgi:hypothetical protein
MSDSLINPPREDKTITWIHMPSKPEVEPRGFPFCAVEKLLADKNKGWEVCEAPFVSKRKVRPTDDGKTHAAVKNATTDYTGLQIAEFLKKTGNEIKEYAAKHEVSLSGCKNKKEMFEALEKADKLYK